MDQGSNNSCKSSTEVSFYKCNCSKCNCCASICSDSVEIDPIDKIKYYLRDEVVIHNKPTDFWVILHGNVLDLTIFIKTREDSMNSNMKLLLQYGGKDLSHYFHFIPKLTPKTRISARGNVIPVFPPVLEKAGSDYFGSRYLSWWQDSRYIIGKITKQPRKLRIINTLTATTQKLTVCEEDTIKDIQQKYNRYNWNHEKYDWRKYNVECDNYSELCMDNTLTENGFFWSEYQEPLTPSLWLFFVDTDDKLN